ncbi:MAG: PAC2 family protein [Candidatus Aenigmarchaeota archaeon]|nr:PAC2 family protein [Candidatus Aenigmarchaeota archaeon]
MSWTIRENKKITTLNDPLLIIGLPGIANVGKIVVDFIIDSKKAEKIVRFHSHALPHAVFVNEAHLVEMPRIELFIVKGTRDLLLLSGDTQPIDERSCHEFCETLLSYCHGLGCAEVVSIGGIALRKVPKKPKLFVTGTNKKHVEQFAKQTPCDSKIYGIVGPIIGITGLSVAHAGERGMRDVCILAETYGHPMYLGVPGAREILKVLDKKYKLKLDLSSLDTEIQQMEADILRTSALPKKMQPEKETSYIG